MKIRAIRSFCGALTMAAGEEREYSNAAVLADLMAAGYVEEVRASQAVVEEPEKEAAIEKRKRGTEKE